MDAEQTPRKAEPRPLRLRRRRLLMLVLPVLACGSGCGYRVGPAFGPEVRSVHVPTFTSESFRRGFELQLTEAVQKEIQLHTPYRLAKGFDADTRLVGRIVDVSKRVLNQTRLDDPRELQLDLAVEVRWENARTGQLLATQQWPIESNLSQAISQVSFAPETGQSLATATQDAVDQLARRIVALMEAPW